MLSLDNTRFYNVSTTDYIEITLRNSGTSDAKVETVYVGNTDSNLISQTVDSYNPTTRIVSTGATLTIIIEHDWDDGARYYFNIATEEGISIPFNREA